MTSPFPNGRELCASSWLIPGLISDDERVQFGDAEVRKNVYDMVIVCEVCAHRKVDTTARGMSLGVMRPTDSTLLQFGEGAPSHPLHGDRLDRNLLECADEREVSFDSVSGKTQAKCFESLQLLEVPENVNFDWHFAEIHFEYDEAAEDGGKVGLGEVINGIGRCQLHIDKPFVRAVTNDIKELFKEDAILAGALDSERLECVNRTAKGKGRPFGGPMSIYIDPGREAGDDQVSPTTCNTHAAFHTRKSHLLLIHYLEHIRPCVKLYIERHSSTPLQNKSYFLRLSPSRKAKGRPHARHRQDDRPPRLTYTRQFQRRTVVTTNLQEKNLSKDFYRQPADGSEEASRISVFLLKNVDLDLKVCDNSLNGTLTILSILRVQAPESRHLLLDS